MQLFPRRPRRRWRADDGQATAEYVGVIVVIAAIVAGIAARADVPDTIRTSVQAAICEVIETCTPQVLDGDGIANGADPDDDGDPDSTDPDDDGGGGLFDGALDVLGDAAGAVGDAAGAVWDGGSALVAGAILGDAGEPYDNRALEGLRNVGHIASGVVVVGDIRDAGIAISSIIRTGDGWDDLAWSGVGLVPLFGDIAKGARGGARVVEAVDGAGDVARGADEAVDGARGTDEVTDGGRTADESGTPAHGLTESELDARRARRGSTNSRDAQILRDNRETHLGIRTPPGHESHHIVPPRHRGGDRAREILDEYDIPYNHEGNGIELPGPYRNPDTGRPYADETDAAPHRRVHTDQYYDELTRRLERAQSRDEALEILEQIGHELATGTFPYR